MARTAILKHSSASETHLDWLLDAPARPGESPFEAGRLWTARLNVPPEHWRDVGAWRVDETFRHRRIYLTHEGDIGGGRGAVRRSDQGEARLLRWTADHVDLDLTLQRFQGVVRMTRMAPTVWLATADRDPRVDA